MPLTSKFFRNVVVQWEISDVLPDGSEDPDLKARARAINAAIDQRWLALTTCIEQDLFAQRIEILNDKKKRLAGFGINLTASPAPGYQLWMDTSLSADVGFDCATLLDWPRDPAVAGERLIDLMQQGLEKLATFADFPVDLVRESCEKFRDRNYVTHLSTVKGSVDGTPLKARIDVSIDPFTTKRHLTILHRGKPLFSTLVTEHDEVDWVLAPALSSLEIHDDTLVYRPMGEKELEWWRKTLPRPAHPLQLPVTVDLTAFPEARALMLDKGWIKA